MLKVRIQGTPEDIEWFRSRLLLDDAMNLSSVSRILPNKGTSQYFRQFFMVNKEMNSEREVQ